MQSYQVFMFSATLSFQFTDETALFKLAMITVGHGLPVDTVVQRFVNVVSVARWG